MSATVKLSDDRERAQRSLHPHAEARLAMSIWSREYAYEQRGGSMDFWDKIGTERRKLCISILDDVLASLKDNGRAKAKADEAQQGDRG